MNFSSSFRRALALFLLLVNLLGVISAFSLVWMVHGLVAQRQADIAWNDASVKKLAQVSSPKAHEYLLGMLTRDKEVDRTMLAEAEALYAGAKWHALLALLDGGILFWIFKAHLGRMTDPAPGQAARVSRRALPYGLLLLSLLIMLGAFVLARSMQTGMERSLTDIAMVDASVQKQLTQASAPEVAKYLLSMVERDRSVSTAMLDEADALDAGARGRALLALLSWGVFFWVFKGRMNRTDESAPKSS